MAFGIQDKINVTRRHSRRFISVVVYWNHGSETAAMTVLGIRCSNTDFAYFVLAGSKARPREIDNGLIALPKDFSPAQSLRWLVQEIDGLVSTHDVNTIAIKGFEGRTRGKTFEIRVEHEAAVMIAGANPGIKRIFKKVKSTIAKDLGQKGRAKYLAHLDTSLLPSFAGSKEKLQDAALVGWSELR